MSNRKDQWEPEDDSTLAETILNHIRTGSTQLVAFEETGERLGRTTAACGFRWNSEVRKHYVEEIRAAKQERNGKKGRVKVSKVVREEDTAKRLVNNLQFKIQRLESQNEKLILQVRELMTELDALKSVPNAFTITDDYMELLKIFQRAREIGALEHTQKAHQEMGFDNRDLENIS
jgi:prespore-specific regulator